MLLAFDTASPLVSVALYDADGGGVVTEQLAERPMKHAEQLAPLIDLALSTAGIVRQDVTAIAVGIGPGPFTGLRVGLVTARTLGFVLDIPVYGVCSLDVLAVEAVDTGAVSGDFVVATDARRKEVYLARYDAGGARLDGPVVDRPSVLATEAQAVGQGAALYPDAFPHRVGPEAPSAGWLARCVAEERAELSDPEPLYLRRPDAVAAHAPQAGLVTVRAATSDDVPAIADLELDNLGDDAWSEGLVREGVIGNLPTISYLVAEVDSSVVGHATASVVADIAELQRIAVDPAHRRTGVATELLDAVVGLARSGGADRLLLEVREDNAGAIAFYAARGFVEVDRRRRYYRDGATAVVLRRGLGPSCG